MQDIEQFTDNFIYYIRDFIDCLFLMYNQVNYCAGYNAVQPGIDLDDLRNFELYFFSNAYYIAPFLDLKAEFEHPLVKRSLFNGSYRDSRLSLIVYNSVISSDEGKVKFIELSNPVSLFDLDKEKDYMDSFVGKFSSNNLKLFRFSGDILDKVELGEFFKNDLGLERVKRLEKFVGFKNR